MIVNFQGKCHGLYYQYSIFLLGTELSILFLQLLYMLLTNKLVLYMVAVAQLKLFKSLASFLSNQKSETLTVQSGIWVSGRRIVGDQGFN